MLTQTVNGFTLRKYISSVCIRKIYILCCVCSNQYPNVNFVAYRFTYRYLKGAGATFYWILLIKRISGWTGLSLPFRPAKHPPLTSSRERSHIQPSAQGYYKWLYDWNFMQHIQSFRECVLKATQRRHVWNRFKGVPGGCVRTRLTVRFYCRNTAAVALFVLLGGVFFSWKNERKPWLWGAPRREIGGLGRIKGGQGLAFTGLPTCLSNPGALIQLGSSDAGRSALGKKFNAGY